MQRREIQIAKAELKATRTILSDQQEQLKTQNKNTEKQAFEETFFQLLRVFTEVTQNLDLVGERGRTTTGKDVFNVFKERLRVKLGKKLNPDSTNYDSVYQEFYLRNASDLGHYFRTIYQLIKYIKLSSIDNKKVYSNLVRAQLSDSELALLFYNGISVYGREKFQPLMEEFGLLKHLNQNEIVNDSLIEYYGPEAFQ